MKYIDIHCHLNSSEYDHDRKEVISRAMQAEVGMIAVGTNLKDSIEAVKIAEENQDVWATIGLHPNEIGNEEFDFDKYKDLAKNPKVVGIGECGIDYFREANPLQQEIFEKQIMIANEAKKPLMLHIRNGKKTNKNAYLEALEIIKRHSKVLGNVHFFAGNWSEARKLLDLGFKLSFTGVITFARDYDEVIKNTPLDMIMTETDAPYVSPVPNRGKRNEPVFVREVAQKISDIKGENLEKTLFHLIDNAKKLFSI